MINVKTDNKKIFIMLTALFLVLTLFLTTTGCFLSSNKPLAPLLLIDVNENTDQNYIRALDPEKLVEVIGKTPIAIGNKQISTLSDDGGKVAIVRWEKADSKEAELVILDVKKWKIKKTGLKIKYNISKLAFGPDGNMLYWVQPASDEKISKDIPKNYQLNSYKIKDKKLRTLKKFKSLYVPDRTRLTKAGDHITVYGINIAKDRMSKGSPQIITLNTKTGKVVADFRITGVKAGLVKLGKIKGGEPQYQSYKPGLTSHKDEPLMYVAHANDNKLTVVDMLKGKVINKFDIKKKVTLLDSISNVFEEPALAFQSSSKKSASKTQVKSSVLPTEKRIALSSDGERLYVTGYEYVDKKVKGKTEKRLVSDGLKILRTSDMTELGKFKLKSNNVVLSPDDRWLLLKHIYYIGSTEKENGGFYIFDTQRQEKVAFLQNKWNVNIDGFSADSRYAYTSYTEGSLGGHNWKKILRVVDLNSQKLLAKREVDGFVGDLMVPKKAAQ